MFDSLVYIQVWPTQVWKYPSSSVREYSPAAARLIDALLYSQPTDICRSEVISIEYIVRPT